MANLTPNPISYLDHNINNDLTWDLLSPFIIPTNDDANAVSDYQTLIPFSNDHFLTQPKLSGLNNQNQIQIHPVLSYETPNHTSQTKRKAEDFHDSSSLVSSSPISSDGNTNINNSRRGKRAKAKANDKAGEKLKDVVHVRARRGQATDSHSIAERVRRGKINERLKCLQDIVPGCNNKAMGMAVMLDEIINYVQSLQNQVEFLSLKLTAASQFHDFNNEIEPCDKMQNTDGSNGNKSQETENIIIKKGYNYRDEDVADYFQPIWPF